MYQTQTLCHEPILELESSAEQRNDGEVSITVRIRTAGTTLYESYSQDEAERLRDALSEAIAQAERLVIADRPDATLQDQVAALTPAQVDNIVGNLRAGQTVEEVAQDMGLSWQVVRRCADLQSV